MSNSIANFVNSQVAIGGAHIHVGFLVDKSGSMHPYTNAVTDGVNQFLKKISSLGEKRLGNLVFSEFSESYTPVLNKAFKDISKSPSYNFISDSYTCLYDSIVRIVKDVEANLEKSDSKKSRVIIPIMTDGQDSRCSTTAEEVGNLIKLKTDQGWEFILLGADSETPAIAGQIGIKPDFAVTFDTGNMKKAIDFVGKKISQLAQGKKLKVTHEERLLLEGSSGRKTEL